MPVTIKRFVNVMSGGKFGKHWADDSQQKRDTRILATLSALEAEINQLADRGPYEQGFEDPAWRKRHNELWTALHGTGGRTGQKLLDYLDGVAAQADQALQEFQAAAPRIVAKLDERKKLLGVINYYAAPAAQTIAEDKGFLSPEVKRTASTMLEGIQDEVQLRTHLAVLPSEAYLDESLEALKPCTKEAVVLGRMTRANLSIRTAEKISEISEAAKANPSSDMGSIFGVLLRFPEQYLETIEFRKQYYQTDFNGLSPEELLAIHAYTSTQGFYRTMNAVLLGSDTLKEAERAQYKKTIECCIKALAKLPDYPAAAQPTYRFEDGSKYDWASQFVVGNTFKNKIFWSTGRTGGYDAGGMVGPRLAITVFGSKAGKDVARMATSETEGGGEVLIPPGTSFKVTYVDRSEAEVVDGKMAVPKTATVYITVKEV